MDSCKPYRGKIRESLVSSVKIFRRLKVMKYLKYFVTFNRGGIFTRIADKKKNKKVISNLFLIYHLIVKLSLGMILVKSYVQKSLMKYFILSRTHFLGHYNVNCKGTSRPLEGIGDGL